MRAGIGFDVHPLVKGRSLILGGTPVPFELGLSGYSDGDVLLHAITDALLGAAALGDMGTHFPTGDPRFKDIASVELLARASALVRQARWQIANVDATIVAERPRLAPYLPAMREQVAHTLGLDVSQVSIKAKSTDGLGFAGRGEGMAAMAVALLQPIDQ